MPIWGKGRGENVLDTGAHFYETYQTKDGKYMAVGAIEPQFYAALLDGLGVDSDYLPHMGEDSNETKRKLAEIFKTKTRDEWTAIFDGTDSCCTPILELHEAPEHPHNKARKAFVKNFNGDLHSPVSKP